MPKSFTHDDHGTVNSCMGYSFWIIRKMKVAGNATSRFWQHKISYITLNSEDHVTSVITHMNMCMRSSKYLKLLTFFFGVFCWVFLSCSYFIQRCKHYVVNFSCIALMCSENRFHSLAFVSWKQMIIFRFNVKLLAFFYSMFNREMLMWRVLWEYLLLVIKFLLRFLNIVGHRCVHMPKSIIPVNRQTTVMIALLFSGAFEICTYCIAEMIRIIIRQVFHAKIVNTEAEFGWPLAMTQ